MDNDVVLWIVVATALAFDFTNGFHDTANAVATSISTRAMKPRVAVTLAAALNFVGAFLSLEVAATVAKGIVDADLVTYVGHSGPRHEWPRSDFANPFVGLRGNRAVMVQRYRDWLAGRPTLLGRIRDGELTGRALGCWCAPEGCHADILAELADG